MEPIRTTASNFTWLGPRPEIADLPVKRDGDGSEAVFRFTDEERAAIAAGANLSIGVLTAPLPPIRLELTELAEIGPAMKDGIPIKPDFRCGNCRALYTADRASALLYNCGWCGNDLAVIYGDERG